MLRSTFPAWYSNIVLSVGSGAGGYYLKPSAKAIVRLSRLVEKEGGHERSYGSTNQAIEMSNTGLERAYAGKLYKDP